MSEFVSDAVIKQLVLANKAVRQAKVAILGLTFKENCPDTRNSKVVDLIEHLAGYNIKPYVVDPQASAQDTIRQLGIELVSLDGLHDMDCVVLAVAHDEFKEMSLEDLDAVFGKFPNDEKVIIDVKSLLDKLEVEKLGYRYWRV